MAKNFAIVVLMIFSLLLFVGCAQTQQQAKVPETPADDVAAGISGINNAENELNTSGLEDLDNTLADIENI